MIEIVEGKNRVNTQLGPRPTPDDRVEKWNSYITSGIEWNSWIFTIIWESEVHRWIAGVTYPPDIRWIIYPETAPIWWIEFMEEYPYYGKSTMPFVNTFTNVMTWVSKIGTWIEGCSFG